VWSVEWGVSFLGTLEDFSWGLLVRVGWASFVYIQVVFGIGKSYVF